MSDLAAATQLRAAYQRLREAMALRVVGQDEVIELMFLAILAGGHALLEGVPGLAKTLLVKTLAEALDLRFRRIQFTPDLMPGDLTGTEIIQQDPVTGHRQFVFQEGPLFAQIILADEINRTPPKTQAALLEAMQERSITIGQRTYPLAAPFFVLATQNPIEQEGTYPLPEAQKDRFLFLIQVRYPSRDEEREIVQRTTSSAASEVPVVMTGEELLQAQQLIRKVPVPPHVLELALDWVRATRVGEGDALGELNELIQAGAGPRASQQLVLAAKARALLHDRTHVTEEDLRALALPVLRHRITPSYLAEAEGWTVDRLVQRVLEVQA